MMILSNRLSKSLAAITLYLFLSGCGDSDKKALEQLQTENAALKQQVATLEQKLSSQTAEASAEQEQSVTASAMSPTAFSDVDKDVPTADMINDLAQLKVFDGLGKTFKPYEPVTRGEYIVWLYNAYNAMRPAEKQMRLAPGFKVPYTDIKPTDPAYKYVQAFGNSGFSVGYENKTFKPNQPITREEMLAIKHGVDGGEMYSDVSTGFSDDQAIDKKYHNSVYSDMIFKSDGPRGNNIMRAFGPIKTFKPKEPVLRYEAAATLWQTDHRGSVTADAALGRKPKS